MTPPRRILLRRARRTAIGVQGCLLAMALTACFSFGGTDDPRRFDCAKRVASEAGLPTVGELVYEGGYGRGGASSGTPTYQYVLVGDDAAEKAETLLQQAGFDGGRTSFDLWTKRDPEAGLIRVVARAVRAGEELSTGAEGPKTFDDASAFISVWCSDYR